MGYKPKKMYNVCLFYISHPKNIEKAITEILVYKETACSVYTRKDWHPSGALRKITTRDRIFNTEKEAFDFCMEKLEERLKWTKEKVSELENAIKFLGCKHA